MAHILSERGAVSNYSDFLKDIKSKGLEYYLYLTLDPMQPDYIRGHLDGLASETNVLSDFLQYKDDNTKKVNLEMPDFKSTGDARTNYGGVKFIEKKNLQNNNIIEGVGLQFVNPNIELKN